MGMLVLQKVAEIVRWLLVAEPPIKQLKDMLPLAEVPIFRRGSCNIESSDAVFEVCKIFILLLIFFTNQSRYDSISIIKLL